jgi:hypothetical protein
VGPLDQKRPKRPTIRAKETYCRGKRDLLSKRDLRSKESTPVDLLKKTCYRGKRDLLCAQKRPTMRAKETYYRGINIKKTARNTSPSAGGLLRRCPDAKP